MPAHRQAAGVANDAAAAGATKAQGGVDALKGAAATATDATKDAAMAGAAKVQSVIDSLRGKAGAVSGAATKAGSDAKAAADAKATGAAAKGADAISHVSSAGQRYMQRWRARNAVCNRRANARALSGWARRKFKVACRAHAGF